MNSFRILTLLLCAMSAATIARAGLIIEEDVTEKGQTRRVVIRVQGSLIRLDLRNGSSVIVDPQKREATTLLFHDAFARVEHGDEAVREAVRQVDTGYAIAHPVPTVGQDKIGRLSCRTVEWVLGDRRIAAWVANDYPDFAKYREPLAVLREIHCRCLPALFADGMALKTVVGPANDARTTTLVSIQLADVPAKEFTIPAGFRRSPP